MENAQVSPIRKDDSVFPVRGKLLLVLSLFLAAVFVSTALATYKLSYDSFWNTWSMSVWLLIGFLSTLTTLWSILYLQSLADTLKGRSIVISIIPASSYFCLVAILHTIMFSETTSTNTKALVMLLAICCVLASLIIAIFNFPTTEEIKRAVDKKQHGGG